MAPVSHIRCLLKQTTITAVNPGPSGAKFDKEVSNGELPVVADGYNHML